MKKDMKKNKPLVSIIVPMYNSENYIEKCIESILDNTFQEFELLIIDDGSTDGSIRHAKFSIGFDDRVKIIECEHQGVSAARNKGLELAKGEWIIFVDSDDYITPDSIETRLKIAQSSEYDVIKCGFRTLLFNGYNLTKKHTYPTGEIDIKTSDPSTYDRSFIFNAIYKSSFLKEHNIKFLDCDIAEDYFFNILCLAYSGKFYNIESPLVYHLNRYGSLSSAFKSKDRNVDHTTMNRIRKLKKVRNDVIQTLEQNPNYEYIKKLIVHDTSIYNEFYEDSLVEL